VDKISEAFSKMSRANFLPSNMEELAHLDMPLSIGLGQTNSQPSTVRMMLEWLDVRPGQKVLDVGYGSGWTSALLSHIVGPKGKVIAVERMPELVRLGRRNCERMAVANAEFHQAGKQFGWLKSAPYGRILVSASASSLPRELIDQLARGGRMVIPVRSSVLVIDKDKNGNISETEHPGFAFVPLI
jgi:protein-L-isoaspartate(D-aspartate) O-methyltransferase